MSKLGRSIRYSEGALTPVDEISSATVDERAVAKVQITSESRCCKSSALKWGIMVHRNTSLYITGNEVELRLGTNIQVHGAIYTVDDFPKYTKIHQQTSPSIIVL